MAPSKWVLTWGMTALVACGPAPASDAGSDASSTDASDSGPVDSFPAELFITGAGPDGAFDPSLEVDPDDAGLVWMAYSWVGMATSFGVTFRHLETRLATSTDEGATWADVGVLVNAAEIDPPLPPALVGLPAAWAHEVPTLEYHPPGAGTWALVWHRYIHAEDGMSDGRQFAYGWISLKLAASPAALATATEIKLFTGLAYHAPGIGDEAWSDTIIGPPVIRLHELDPALASCVAFTEPGLHSFGADLYLSLVCANPTSGNAIILLRAIDPATTWEYVGTLADDADAMTVNPVWVGFSAPELFDAGGVTYLSLSPTEPFAPGVDLYAGCTLFQVEALMSAALVRAPGSGLPIPLLEVRGVDGGVNDGACSYDEAAPRAGIVYVEAHPEAPPFARIYKSGVNP